MPNYCTIIVHYNDGSKEEYYGGLHLSDGVLRIWPQHGPAVSIPLTSIRKYEVSN